MFFVCYFNINELFLQSLMEDLLKCQITPLVKYRQKKQKKKTILFKNLPFCHHGFVFKDCRMDSHWTVTVCTQNGQSLYAHLMDSHCMHTEGTVTVCTHNGQPLYAHRMDSHCMHT